MSQTGTLKAGYQLVIEGFGAEGVDYDVSLQGADVSISKKQIANSQAYGPYEYDATYTVTVVSGSPSIYKVQPNGKREYTADTLPDPATLGAGAAVVVDGEPNVTDSVGYFNYLNWHVSTAIPFILQSSGSVGANGALTLNTAITDNTISGTQLFISSCYMYFVAGAVYSGSIAGWYYVEMQSATAGVIYNNIYTTGTPQIPSSKTPIISASIGAYTQTTGSVNAVSLNVGKNTLGRNGFATCLPAFLYPNNANGKAMQVLVNDTVVHNKTRTTSTISTPVVDVRSRGSVRRQISTTSDSATFSLGATNSTYASAVDTTEDVSISVRMAIASASDYMILESMSIHGFPQDNHASDAEIVISNSQISVPTNMFGMQYNFSLPTSDVTNKVARNWDQKNGTGLISKIASVANFCPTTAGVYDYTGFDGFFAANADKDILFALGWPADWMITRSATGSSAYGTKGNMVPTGATELNNYIPVITAMVQRAITTHGRTGLKWELWNEIQGTAYFKDAYANLVPYAKAVYQAIKAVDPTAIILSPSVNNEPNAYLLHNFLSTTDGATGYGYNWIDGLAVHQYSNLSSPWMTAYSAEVYKSVLSRNGIPSTPIYMTETGALYMDSIDNNTKNICRRMLVAASIGYKMFVAYSYDYGFNPLSVIAPTWNEVIAKVSGKTITKCVKNADGSVTVTFADASTYTV
jgi:hypothetical protein